MNSVFQNRLWALAGLLWLCAVPAGLGAQTVEDVGWLQGCWATSSDENNQIEEIWTAPRGGMMLGTSRTVRDGAARAWEFLSLRVTDGSLVYTARPSGQSPADFAATAVSADSVRFVNPTHDFPQAIVYHSGSGRTLSAAVFGTAAATEPAFVLEYAAAACPG